MNKRNLLRRYASGNELILYVIIEIEAILRGALIEKDELGEPAGLLPDFKNISDAGIEL